jgi:hypothetical protein
MKTNDKIEFNFMKKDDYYNNHKHPFNKDNENYIKKYEKWYIGYIGFTKTFSGMFMHSYAGNKDNDNKSKRNYQKILHNNILKQRESIKHIEFIYSDYLNLKIENNSIIYLDPPYFNTTKYSKNLEINQDEFYKWCKNLVYNKNCIIFLSEYNAPKYFELIFKKELKNGLGQKKQTEKLFILKK